MKPTYEELQERSNEFALQIQELERERNELAAQVERLRDVLANFYDYIHCERMSTDGAVTYSTTTINHHAFMASSAINEAPPAALAALKAQWQADILESTSIQIAAGKPEVTKTQIAIALLEESKRIRQRAKEAGE